MYVFVVTEEVREEVKSMKDSLVLVQDTLDISRFADVDT